MPTHLDYSLLPSRYPHYPRHYISEGVGVVNIGRSTDYGEGYSFGFDHNMALRTRFALICGVRPCSLAPFLAAMWIVERTLAWLGRYRRLSKDYEYLTRSSEAFVYWAMS